jgi:hypothetical protein
VTIRATAEVTTPAIDTIGPRGDHSEDDPRNRDDDLRGFERDRDSRNRDESLDPRDVFMRDLDLPRGPDREIVHDDRDRQYTLRASETRTLSTVGAFRVVSARDLRDHNERPLDPRSGDLLAALPGWTVRLMSFKRAGALGTSV